MSALRNEMLRSGRNGVEVFDTLCQITGEQRGRKLFVDNTMETAQIRSVETMRLSAAFIVLRLSYT